MPASPLYARVAVVKFAYVIPVSSEALTSTQRVVAVAVCLCHLYVIVPDWSTVAAATNVPAPLEDVELAGCVPTVITSTTSAAIVSSDATPAAAAVACLNEIHSAL